MQNKSEMKKEVEKYQINGNVFLYAAFEAGREILGREIEECEFQKIFSDLNGCELALSIQQIVEQYLLRQYVGKSLSEKLTMN